MTITFTAPVWFWRGPAPYHFLTIPEEESRRIKEIEKLATYGWGMIPVVARIGETEFRTSLWPKGAVYLLPLKDVVRKAECLAEGDQVTARIEVIMGPSG